MPIAGFVDTTPTGSISRPSDFLSDKLDQEDWRRAKAAMGTALDPQGNGARVSWDNPKSGAKGSFAATAPAFAQSDKVCRSFTAHVVAPGGSGREVVGAACRGGDGDWAVADIRDGKAGKG